MSLQNLLKEIRDDLRALPSVKRVYDDVPESVNEFPAVIVAALGGRCWLASHDSTIHCEHDIRVEIHTPRKGLEIDAETMTGVAEDVSYALYDGFITDRYSGTMVTTGNPRTGQNATNSLEYQIGTSMWGDRQTYAMTCDFKVTTER